MRGDGTRSKLVYCWPIWLISQFPAKHTVVASKANIVFARPKVTASRFSETHQLLFDPLESEFMSVM